MLASPEPSAAVTSVPLLDAIAQRWSPRAFTAQPVSDEALTAVLEAARWAPSSSNEQPWRYVVARQSAEGYEAVLACLNDANQRWAKDAPVLLLAYVRTHSERTGKALFYGPHDLGAASVSLALQATALGLQVHQMAGLHKDAMRALPFAPEGCEPMTAIALGYAGVPEDLPDDLAERERAPRTRKPLSEIVTHVA